MARVTASDISINTNLRCNRVYPISETSKSIADLKTIGVKLTRDQAIHLARVLLATTQDWEEIDLTCYRMERRRSDGTYRITVTAAR